MWNFTHLETPDSIGKMSVEVTFYTTECM